MFASFLVDLFFPFGAVVVDLSREGLRQIKLIFFQDISRPGRNILEMRPLRSLARMKRGWIDSKVLFLTFFN